MKGSEELVMRRVILIGAGIAWGVSLGLAWAVVVGYASQAEHPGIGLIVFMSQGLGITLTIVWSQLRQRRTLVEVMRVGMRVREMK